MNLRKFEFAPELSNGLTLDDNLTLINTPLAGVGAVLGDLVEDQIPLSVVTRPLIFATMSTFFESMNEKLFKTYRIRDIVFGHRIRFADTMDALVIPLTNLGLMPAGMLPPPPPNNTFGLLYGKDVPEGPFEIYTGQHGMSHLYMQHATWEGKAELDWWGGSFCNQIRGSGGDQFPPMLKKTDILWAFR